MLFKFLKNVSVFSESEEVHMALFVNYFAKIIQKYFKHFIKIALTESKLDELKIELIGIMANVKMGAKWEEFLNPTMIEFIKNNLQNGVVEDDIILETIQLVSTISDFPKGAEVLASIPI